MGFNGVYISRTWFPDELISGSFGNSLDQVKLMVSIGWVHEEITKQGVGMFRLLVTMQRIKVRCIGQLRSFRCLICDQIWYRIGLFTDSKTNSECGPFNV